MVRLSWFGGFLLKEKRVFLSSKRGNRFYYKGRGSGSRGEWLKSGTYSIQKWKIYNFVVPDLTDCKLRPYVSSRTPIVKVDGTYSDDLVHLARTEIELGGDSGETKQVQAQP